MGASYQRQDVSNNIANGNIINADDLDAEFNALDGAFAAVTGHSHDGTAGEGGPITLVGPAQDLIVNTTQVLPKTDNTLDLGSSTFEFKDLWIDGTANIDSLIADTADINAGTIDNTPIGATTPSTGVFTSISASSGVVEANSSSTAFRITQTGTGEALRVEDSTNPDASPFLVSATGDVGIGMSPTNVAGYSTLAFNNTSGGNIEFHVGGSLSSELYSSSDGTLRIGTQNAASTFLRTNNTDRLEIDGSGNIGVNGAPVVLAGDTTFSVNSNTQDAHVRVRYLNNTVAYFKTSQNLSASLMTDGAIPLRIGTNNSTSFRIGATTGNLSINRGNADGDARAAIDVGGTDKGVLLPRLNTTQRDALTTPPTGLLIYNTTNNRLEFYTGSAWAAVGAGTTTLSDLGVTATATELNVLDNVTTNGLVTRTAAGTGTARSIAAGTGIAVTNGDGVAGNPTVAVSGNLSSLAGVSLAAGDVLYATGANTLVRLGIGTAGQVLRVNTGATAPEWTSGGGAPDFVLEDQKASGTNGQTIAAAGTWTTRDLNTEVRDVASIVSIASNQFTVTANCWVEWQTMGRDRHMTRLQNITDAVTVATSMTDGPQANAMTSGGGACVAGKTYEIQVNTATAGQVHVTAAGRGVPEVYTRIRGWRT